MRRARGFTLLEVMLALALLGLGLTVLIKSAAGSIFSAQQAHMTGVVTDLLRGKMYDLEEKLLKDGFSDTEQHEEDQAFTEEGWPTVHYSYKIEEVELPSFEALQALAAGSGSAGSAAGSAAGKGSDSPGGFQDSALGGMMAQFGGLGGGGAGAGSNIDAAQGGAFIQSQYTMFQQILKVSIRKVTLTATWQVMGSDRDLKVVAFFTDAAAMDKVINGLGASELPENGGGGTSGGGAGGGTSGGSGGGKTPTTPPVRSIPGGPNTPPPPGVGQ